MSGSTYYAEKSARIIEITVAVASWVAEHADRLTVTGVRVEHGYSARLPYAAVSFVADLPELAALVAALPGTAVTSRVDDKYVHVTIALTIQSGIPVELATALHGDDAVALTAAVGLAFPARPSHGTVTIESLATAARELASSEQAAS